jgi:hypothetical protein
MFRCLNFNLFVFKQQAGAGQEVNLTSKPDFGTAVVQSLTK